MNDSDSTAPLSYHNNINCKMCKKQFKTKGIRDTGSKEEEADTVYLLAKKLPHTLVSDQNDEFKKLLAETEAKDIVAFAQAVDQQAKDIDGKVCAKKKVHNAAKQNESKESSVVTESGGAWSCIDYTGTGNTTDKHRAVDPHETKGFYVEV